MRYRVEIYYNKGGFCSELIIDENDITTTRLSIDDYIKSISPADTWHWKKKMRTRR